MHCLLWRLLYGEQGSCDRFDKNDVSALFFFLDMGAYLGVENELGAFL